MSNIGPGRITTPYRPEPWAESAACVGKDPEIWFSPLLADEAVSICATCTVRDSCDDFAARWDESDGIWAGVDRGERRTKGAAA